MLTTRASFFILVIGVLTAPVINANPISLAPIILSSEELLIDIDSDGEVSFQGSYFFDYIDPEVEAIQYPLPPGEVSNLDVVNIDPVQGGPTTVPWYSIPALYPTVLAAYPNVPIVEWEVPPSLIGPTEYIVSYQHQLFSRDDNLVFFYPLGSGDFTAVNKRNQTEATIVVAIPDSLTLDGVFLDNTPLDPSLYSFIDSTLQINLVSEQGSLFTEDLIIEFDVPIANSLSLFALGLLATGAIARRR